MGIAGVLALGACTDTTEGEDTPTSRTTAADETTVDLAPIDTSAMAPRGTVVEGLRTVQLGQRSALVTTQVGGRDPAPFTRVVDPATGRASTIDVADITSVRTGGDARTAVVAGERWVDGDHTELWVRSSTDLRSWTPVPISFPGRGWSISAVAVLGGRPVVLGIAPDGGRALLSEEGGTTVVRPLPHEDGRAEGVLGIVELEGTWLAVREHGVEGGATVHHVLASTDEGRTWRDRGKVGTRPGNRHDLTGVAAAGGRVVITGSVTGTDRPWSEPMTWVSTDGRRWREDRVQYDFSDMSQDEIRAALEQDREATAPVAIGRTVVISVTCQSCRETRIATVGGAGQTVAANPFGDLDAARPTALPIAPAGQAVVTREQGSVVVRTKGGPRSGRFVVRGVEGRSLQSVQALGSGVGVATSRPYFRETGDGWSTSSETTTWRLSKDAVTEGSWRPIGLATLANPMSSTNPEGVRLSAGTLDTRDGFTVSGYRSVGTSSTRVQGTGLHPFEDVADVTWADGAFRLAVQVAPDSSSATTRTARVYSSADGRRVMEDAGRWTQGKDLGSSVSGICALADGDTIGVGWTERPGHGSYDATAWVRVAGRWQMRPQKTPNSGTSYFSSCATVAGTTVVDGWRGGEQRQWTTTDGTTFTLLAPLPRGVTRDIAHEVEGGLVATGSLRTPEHTGPVIWHSTDGTRWQWAPVPVSEGDAGLYLEQAGKELYLGADESRGPRLWRVTGISGDAVTAGEG